MSGLVDPQNVRQQVFRTTGGEASSALSLTSRGGRFWLKLYAGMGGNARRYELENSYLYG